MTQPLFFSWIQTPLEPMIAIADEDFLYLLEFKNRKKIKKEIDSLQKKFGTSIKAGRTEPIDSIEQELTAYFNGSLSTFTTPYKMFGTLFQQQVWKRLEQIPFGKTKSYGDIAQEIGNKSSYRAVGLANGTNQLAIIIPCHRVINKNGNLGGYGAGLPLKKWLLAHEEQL